MALEALAAGTEHVARTTLDNPLPVKRHHPLRVLFLVGRFPYPPLQGDRLRALHQLKAMARRHRVTLVAPLDSQECQGGVKSLESVGIRVVGVSPQGYRRIGSLARAPFTSDPLQVLLWRDERYLKILRDLIQAEPFDVAHVQLVRMGWTLPVLQGLPVVVDFVDALSVNMRERAECASFPLSTILKIEAARMQRYEQDVTRAVNRVILASPDDLRAIGSPDNATVVSNGVETVAVPFREPGGRGATIMFLGRMAYPPNVDSATWFARSIFPRIRAELPGAKFVIVGSQPSFRVRGLGRIPGVTVTGTVPNVQDYFARADVFVAPVRRGTGIQNKVLEAMASGVPVVAHLRAVRAIGAVHDEHCLAGTTEAEIAEHVVRLIRDKPTAKRLARAARDLVESSFSWERAVLSLEDVYHGAFCGTHGDWP